VARQLTKYERIAADLRARIGRGDYPAGTRLPGYEDLTAAFGVGRATIRQALAVLEAEGLITVVKKAGIMVRTPGERRRVARGRNITRDPRRGYIFPAAAHPGEPWQTHGQPRRSTEPIPAEVAQLLEVAPGSPVVRRRRVTSPAGEPPFQLVDTWLAPSAVEDAPRAAEADTGPGGYIDRLEEAGHGPISWREFARVRMPTGDEARLLGMPAGMPVLQVALVGTSARTGRPVDVTVRVIPGDRVELVHELRRSGAARWPVRPVEP
jgi:GntR family transcriptional regulator